jgi:hypothetical protein
VYPHTTTTSVWFHALPLLEECELMDLKCAVVSLSPICFYTGGDAHCYSREEIWLQSFSFLSLSLSLFQLMIEAASHG